MKRLAFWSVFLVGLSFGISFAQAQGFLDRIMERATLSAEQALSRQADKTINQTLNKLDECLTTDKECIKRAKDQGKEVTIINTNTSQASDSMKCMATDPACLKQAKAQGKKVEIVDEADLDMLRCSVSDADCLKRAKSLGKKVEIID